MRFHSHRLTRMLIRRFHEGHLANWLRRYLFRQLDQCPPCGGLFEQYNRLEKALHREELGLSPYARDRIFANIDIPVRSAERRARGVAKWAGSAGLVATMLTMTILFYPQPEHRISLRENSGYSEPRLAARGAHGARTADSGIRVLAVSDSARETTQVTTGDVITFTYTRVAKSSGYLALFGVQADGELIWYYPSADGQGSIPIEGDGVDIPLGDGFDLSVHHHPGWLRITALFSETPLSVGDIESAVADNTRMDNKKLAPLDSNWFKSEFVEHSLRLELK